MGYFDPMRPLQRYATYLIHKYQAGPGTAATDLPLTKKEREIFNSIAKQCQAIISVIEALDNTVMEITCN